MEKLRNLFSFKQFLHVYDSSFSIQAGHKLNAVINCYNFLDDIAVIEKIDGNLIIFNENLDPNSMLKLEPFVH